MMLLNIPYNVFANNTLIESVLSTEQSNNNKETIKNNSSFAENLIQKNTLQNILSNSRKTNGHRNYSNNENSSGLERKSNTTLINFSPINYASNFAGGDGTKENPYQISTPEELSRISYLTNTLKVDTTDMYFELLNDIDLSDYDSDNSISNGNWTPIGYNNANTYDDYFFSGNINGNDFTISNLSVKYTNSDYIGFIGVMDGGSVVNLNLENVDITAKSRGGGLIGCVNSMHSDKDITIKNITVSGKLTGDERIGGLIGGCYTGDEKVGSISNCFTNVSITSPSSYDIGAFIGSADNIIITDSSSTGNLDLYNKVGDIGGFMGAYYANDVRVSRLENCTSDVNIVINKYDSSNIWIGGFIGYYDNGHDCEVTDEYQYVIRNCSSKGVINYLTGKCIGGFIGWAEPGIINCSTTVDLIGDGQFVGGFIGEVSDSVDGLTAINKCYSNNNIQGNINVGGFAGDVYEADIINCYSMSNITCNSDAGGFIGRVRPTYYGEGNQIIKNNYSVSTIKTNYDWYVGLTDAFVYSFDYNGPYIFENNYYDSSVISDKCKNNSNVIKLTTEDMIGYNTYKNMDLDYDNIWIAHKYSYPTFIASNTAPELSGNDIKLILNQDYDLLDYVTVEDFEDKDLVPKIVTDLDITQLGDYTATFTVSDAEGLSDTLTLSIKVLMENPIINAEDVELLVNDEFDEKKGVTATDVDGLDITEHIKIIENTVNTKIPGEYKVIYEVESLYRDSVQKEIKVIVKGNPILNNDKDNNLNNTDKDNNKPSKPGDDKVNPNTTIKPQTIDNFALYNIFALVSSAILLCINKKSEKE